MTIDERPDRFTERHEDLTQTAEFLARTTHEHTQQIGDITGSGGAAFARRANPRTAPDSSWKVATMSNEAVSA